MDATDKKILSLLQENGRITVKEMSNRLNLSSTPIFERIKKMERSGVIDHYTVVVNSEIIGKKLYAFAHISLKDHSKVLVKEFEEKILLLPEVSECHYVTGRADFIIKIQLEDMDRYKEFVMDKLFDVPNIARIETYLSLEMKKKKVILF
jgi:DNA-binding Lrp family transcriptional regulator